MSDFPSTRAKRVLAALLRTGWTIKCQTGSHRTLSKEGMPDVVFAFTNGDEIGPKLLARIAKNTGLTAADL
jgi:predicted RNA binding protein YcfA (HicA-like mRNA interferase family)